MYNFLFNIESLHNQEKNLSILNNLLYFLSSERFVWLIEFDF